MEVCTGESLWYSVPFGSCEIRKEILDSLQWSFCAVRTIQTVCKSCLLKLVNTHGDWTSHLWIQFGVVCWRLMWKRNLSGKAKMKHFGQGKWFITFEYLSPCFFCQNMWAAWPELMKSLCHPSPPELFCCWPFCCKNIFTQLSFYTERNNPSYRSKRSEWCQAINSVVTGTM